MQARHIAGVTVLIFCGCAASAQSGSGERVLQSLRGCRQIATAETRLECFDKATSALEDAVKSKEVTILDRQDVRQARRSLFGFTLPRIGLFSGGDNDGAKPGQSDEFNELNTTITTVRPQQNGRVELRLAEGDAVWVTTDPMPFPPTPGTKIRIRKGALGNYFLAIAGERSVRGMRLR